MKEIQRFTFEGGLPMTMIVYKGKPAWLARDVGRALGYTDGRGLVTLIRRDWSAELDEGEDFEIVVGEDLKTLKALLEGSSVRVVDHDEVHDSSATTSNSTNDDIKFAPSLMLLYEEGVYLVCLKTDKPVGKQLRRWLKKEVMPQIAQTGEFSTPNARLKREASTGDRQLDYARELRRLATMTEAGPERQRLIREAAAQLVPSLRSDFVINSPEYQSLLRRARFHDDVDSYDRYREQQYDNRSEQRPPEPVVEVPERWNDPRLINRDVSILLAIECHGGRFSESIIRLAEETRILDRAVRNRVKRLVTLGILAREEHEDTQIPTYVIVGPSPAKKGETPPN